MQAINTAHGYATVIVVVRLGSCLTSDNLDYTVVNKSR